MRAITVPLTWYLRLAHGKGAGDPARRRGRRFPGGWRTILSTGRSRQAAFVTRVEIAVGEAGYRPSTTSIAASRSSIFARGSLPTCSVSSTLSSATRWGGPSRPNREQHKSPRHHVGRVLLDPATAGPKGPALRTTAPRRPGSFGPGGACDPPASPGPKGPGLLLETHIVDPHRAADGRVVRRACRPDHLPVGHGATSSMRVLLEH